MKLARASKQDAAILSAIHEECFPNYWNIEAFNDFFAVPGTHILIASSCGTRSVSAGSRATNGDPVQPRGGSQDDEPAGMMVYRVQFDQADIITLAVKPAFRRKGMACALVENALAHMTQLGAKTIFLDVEDGNQPAISLYESLGFSHERRRKLYYRQKDGTYTDALVMKKKIA